MSIKIANRDARDYVRRRIEFHGSNLHSEWLSSDDGHNWYVVFSYDSWPLFIFDDTSGAWFENADKYSVTTSKHRTQSDPLVPTTKMSSFRMIEIAEHGLVGTVAQRLNRENASTTPMYA